MALRVATQVSDDIDVIHPTQVHRYLFIVHCEGRIVFGDEGAVLRKRIRQLLTGTKKSRSQGSQNTSAGKKRH